MAIILDTAIFHLESILRRSIIQALLPRYQANKQQQFPIGTPAHHLMFHSPILLFLMQTSLCQALLQHGNLDQVYSVLLAYMIMKENGILEGIIRRY